MWLEIGQDRVETEGVVSVRDEAGARLYFPAEAEPILRLRPGLSVAEVERRCFLRRIPAVRVSDDEVAVSSDYIGMRHLYLYERFERGELRVTVADDPFAFAGTLEPDVDLLRLVPALRFVPLPLSCVTGTVRLLPGTRRVYARVPLRFKSERNVLSETFAPGAGQDQQNIVELLEEIIDEYLDDAPRAHVLLSGGMDSALLTYLLRVKGRGVTAWTATFDSPLGRLEAERAAQSARFLGAEHCILRVEERALAEMSAVLDTMREPFADVATIAEAILTRYAGTRGARSAFEGEAVDTLMCGSYKFVAERYRPVIRLLMAILPRAAIKGVGRSSRLDSLRLKVRQLKDLAGGSSSDFERHFNFLVAADAWRAVPQALQKRVRDTFEFYHSMFDGVDRLCRLSAMTVWGNIPNCDNRKLDVVERYSGVRLNLIFQDVRFIRKALATPSTEKVRRGYGKWCMRQAFRDRLPPHTLTRKKLSFVPPVLEWIGPRERDVLLDGSVFDTRATERLLLEHQSRERDHLVELWGIFVTNHWLRRYRAARRSSLPWNAPAGAAG